MSKNWPVNEGNDDVLHIHIGVQLSARPQEGAQGLQVKLVRENLVCDKCKDKC